MTEIKVGNVVLININKIIPQNKNLDPEYISRLSESIKKNGIIQPILIRSVNYGLYETVCGNKRLKASKLAGLKNVPCVLTDIDEKSGVLLNAVDNSFKSDNNLFYKAELFKSLIIDYGYSIDEISDKLNIDIFEVINNLKMLNFSRKNKIKIINSNLSYNQCLMLTKLENTEYFDDILDEILINNLSDFQTKELIDKTLKNKRNTAIFKDIRIFTNTIENAINRMKSAGISAEIKKTENSDKIEYSILIDVKSQNK